MLFHGPSGFITCSVTNAEQHMLMLSLQDTRQALGQRRAQAKPCKAVKLGKQHTADTENLDPEMQPAAHQISTAQPGSVPNIFQDFPMPDGKGAKPQHQLHMPHSHTERTDSSPSPATAHGAQGGVQQEITTDEGPLGKVKEAAGSSNGAPAVAREQPGSKVMAMAGPMYQEGLPQGQPLHAAAAARSTTSDLMCPPTPGQVSCTQSHQQNWS